jgi:protein involved in polysaccharide export with SLBB domain
MYRSVVFFLREGTMQQPFVQKLFLRFMWSLFGIVIFAVAGCSYNPASYSQSAQNANARLPMRSSPGSYALGTNDQLHIQVYNEPTITGDYVIDGTGFLSIPVAGRIKAAGLTTQQLERSVTAKLNGGILKDARVTIQIGSYAPFYIRGEVKKPGEFPYKPGLTLGDAVAMAGGYTYRANESKAYVRPSGGIEIAHPLDVDPTISPGDNIRIPERFF